MIISNSKIKIIFDDNPQFIKGIYLSDGTVLGAAGQQSLLVRTAAAVSEPILLSRAEPKDCADDRIEIIFQDHTGAWRAELQICSTETGIRFYLRVEAPEPIWLVEWRLSSLNFDQVIIPALGGQVLTREMPAETTLSYKYPFWWNAQFVIGNAENGGLWMFSQDKKPNLKLLRVGKDHQGFMFTYGSEAIAPLTEKMLESEWYLDGFIGSWRLPVLRHQSWLEATFALSALEQQNSDPAWAREINFVLELWGASRNSETPMHTFEQMTARLEAWKAFHAPNRTLVYLPGFAENGIDSHAPDYNPSQQCGGAEKFRQLVDTAHKWGYRVMVHTNVLAMTFGHLLYPKFKKHQVRDCFGRDQGWGLDLDGDWLAEPFFAYINPGAKEWGDLMEQVLGTLIQKFAIDAVFLDQTLLAFNVSNGPNFLEGMRNHIQRLRDAFPEILFAGEGMHEHVLKPLALAQIHGIDSLYEIHGQEGQCPWRSVHPVSAFLFGKYVKFVPHLLTKHPSHPLFKFQEAAYEKLGILPALCLYHHHQPMDLPEVKMMIARANDMTKNLPGVEHAGC